MFPNALKEKRIILEKGTQPFSKFLSLSPLCETHLAQNIPYLAMSHQPLVGGVHVGGWCADPSGLLALDYQPLSVGGNSGEGVGTLLVTSPWFTSLLWVVFM